MKEYTVIWEDHWVSGSHHSSRTRKTWIECDDIREIMRSSYGDCAVYIFEGFQCTIGEEFDSSKVIRTTDMDFE